MSTVKVNVEGFEYQLTGVKTQENKDGVLSGFVYALNELDKSQYFGWFRWDQRYENPIFGYKDAEGKTHKICKGQIIEYIKWKLGEGTQQQKEVKQMNKYNDTVIYGRVAAAAKKEFDLSVAETVKYINLYIAEGGELDYNKLLEYVHRSMADEKAYDDEVIGAEPPFDPVAPAHTDEDAPAPSDEDAPLPEEDLDNMPDYAE